MRCVLPSWKSALIKQYAKLSSAWTVWIFRCNKDALTAMAREALKRGTGARGLRSILERIMLDVMYDIPSRRDVRSVTLTEAFAAEGDRPPLIR